MPNKAIIPLYLNTDVLNNLFTIVIQEFVEIKSISTKDVVTVHLKSPMSEFSYDLFGKYIQGDLELAFQNEFTKQRTEEKISTIIVILKKLKDILNSQGILKQLDDLNDLSSIEESDYIEFTTQLQANPVLKRVNNIIQNYEIQNMFGEEQKDEKKEFYIKDEMIPFLKKGLDDCRSERCQRHICYPIAHSSSAFVVPIKNCCMLDYEDYLLNGKVSIMGKVVRKHIIPKDMETAVDSSSKQEYISNLRRALLSQTMFDNINLTRLVQKMNMRFPGININLIDDDINVMNLDNIIEILPISISI